MKRYKAKAIAVRHARWDSIRTVRLRSLEEQQFGIVFNPLLRSCGELLNAQSVSLSTRQGH